MLLPSRRPGSDRALVWQRVHLCLRHRVTRPHAGQPWPGPRSLLNKGSTGGLDGAPMGVVQGTSHPEHVVMDAESALDRLMPPGSVYAFLAEHRRELFPDAMFGDLFPRRWADPACRPT